MRENTFERFERIHPEDFSVSTVEGVFDNSGQLTDFSGGWRECGDGKSLVRLVPKAGGGGFPKLIDYAPRALPRNPKASPTPRNLATYRWRGPGLEAAEEVALIHAAQAGDKRAGGKLFRAFHRKLLKIAGKHRGHHSLGRETNEFFDELMAAGALAFWECVQTYRLDVGYRFVTYTWRRIHGAISDEAKRYRKRGITGETLLQRIAFTRPYYPEITHAEGRRLQKRYRSFPDAFRALGEAYREVDNWTQPYSYSGGGEDDNRSLTGVLLVNGGADEAWQKEPEAPEWINRLYDCFNPYKHSPQLRLCGTNTRGLSGAHSRYIDGLAEDADKRARRRIKQIGRRAYAIELVERQQRQLAAVKERDRAEWAAACRSRELPAQNPRITTAETRIINRQRRHKQRRSIRAWRAAA